MKRCTKCRSEKPLTDFPSDRSRKDGLANKCRPCCYETWKSWRAKNLEHSQAYHRQYRAMSAEEKQARALARVFATSEDRARYQREWYERHANDVKQRAREWRQANPERYSASTMARRRVHPEQHAQLAAKYRARKRANTVERVDYAAVIERDERTCHICGDAVDLSLPKYHPMSKSFDHVIPLSKGGSHSMVNVKLAHFGCNSRKGAR